MQTLISFQYLEFSKFITVSLAIIFAILYVYYWKPKESPTVFWSVAVVRIGMTSCSWATLFLSPLFLFFLNPAMSYWIWFNVWFSIYGVFALMFGVITIVDMYKYAPQLVMYLGGLNKGSKEVKEVMRNIFSRRGF